MNGIKDINIDLLCRLALYGSPAARAAALTILDELSGGKLFEKLQEGGLYEEQDSKV